MATLNIVGAGGIIEGDLGDADIDINLDSVYDFDGVDDYLEDSSVSGLPSGDTFTVSAWVRYTGTSGDWPIWRRDAATDNFVFRLSETYRKIQVRKYGDETATADTQLVAGVWYHVAISINALSATFYLNGVADGTHTFTGGFAHANEVNIGEYGGAYADGNIADVRVYDAALSAANIQVLASKINGDSSLGAGTTNLKGWWKLTNSDLTDSSTNSNTLTASGSPDTVYPFSVNVQDGDDTTTDGTFDVSQGKLECLSLSYPAFDGADDYITVTDDGGAGGDSLDGMDALTVSAWVKPTDLLDDYMEIADKSYLAWKLTLKRLTEDYFYFYVNGENSSHV